jgi:hypothetical protein
MKIFNPVVVQTERVLRDKHGNTIGRITRTRHPILDDEAAEVYEIVFELESPKDPDIYARERKRDRRQQRN